MVEKLQTRRTTTKFEHIKGSYFGEFYRLIWFEKRSNINYFLSIPKIQENKNAPCKNRGRINRGTTSIYHNLTVMAFEARKNVLARCCNAHKTATSTKKIRSSSSKMYFKRASHLLAATADSLKKLSQITFSFHSH